ncbi:cytochrome P450 [Paracoccus seriniphilus]|uniref:Cytochrome P450 n=1 Tax=Paracoccus seriniphilus TaxID=184748 RepID=A0A239Q2N1_9RHOB|nr:cytochrome P450 [Paracoccus seriniphilus]WCR13262.1 cytochrome P450 [Paracoccus seriniphilus]SNT76463.1 Cytochrome P450 [Paracoccus seriniphilus]
MIPPKPRSTEGRSNVLRLAKAFRSDLLSALPARLYRAWMAEYRSPLIHSFVCNDPALVRLILRERPDDFPKSNRLREGLAPLLGNSVFVTNGAEWAHQRRIIDPAFEGGRLREVFPALWSATDAAIARLEPGETDIEPATSHAAADAIFRTLFSLPIEHQIADSVFRAFRAHQEAQPIVNPAALLPLPPWVPRLHSRKTRATAAEIRGLIEALVAKRLDAIRNGTAPDDLANKIMTTPDPETGRCFSGPEMVDQVAIFFLAGHETSASALAWALWLLAAHPDWQERVATEGAALTRDFSAINRLRATRAVFRETLRLYPPVPMMVRQPRQQETFRGRNVPKNAQLVLSPWHLHRHERLWERPDEFDPGRWDSEAGKASASKAYIPFSAGQRVCPGAGFAMLEGVLMLSRITAAYHLTPTDQTPVPVARLTVRGRNGIMLRLTPRAPKQRPA